MFRKNEEALEEWSADNVQMCADRQDEILEEGAKMLRPGGRICYSTCTFAPAENEDCMSRFITSHPEFHLVEVEKKGEEYFFDFSKSEFCNISVSCLLSTFYFSFRV